MKNSEIVSLLQAIDATLKNTTVPDASLMGGTAGILLYRFNYLQYFRQFEEEEESLLQAVQHLATQAAYNEVASFCNGRAGINWLFAYLCKQGLLYEEDVDMLCHDRQELADMALAMLEEGNYDLLHGATGIAYYLLYHTGGRADTWPPHFFRLLTGMLQRDSAAAFIPAYDFVQQKIQPGITNLGLAHGVPSLLKFCLQCYRHRICPQQAGALAKEMMYYLLEQANGTGETGCFPHTVTAAGSDDRFSRLAWCYGDISTGYVLHQAGRWLDDAKAAHLAKNILLQSTVRRTPAQTGVRDACVCHGAAGLAHLYNRLWHSCREPAFKEACDYWVQQTLAFAVHPDAPPGFKKYQPATATYVYDPGLLDGLAGIGLSLLSYTTGDFDWDYCLMLDE